jgi:hypothetical protein
MKIISVDPRRGLVVSDDRLVADHIDPYYIDTIVSALNEVYSGDRGERTFKAVPDDYQLKTY